MISKGELTSVSVGVVIPAAGQGKRMGTKESKQFLLFHQKPILLHTLDVFEFHPEIDEIVVVVRENEIERTQKLIDMQGYKKVCKIVAGGRERQESVFLGLKDLSTDLVLVHDAVRPFVTEKAVTRLISEIRVYDAAILAVPVKDTVKKVDESNVLETLERRQLWAVQTPQGFRRELLVEAHTQAEKEADFATDDAALVEKLGINVRVVDGEYTNIKITTPEDLLFAEAIYRMKG